MLKFLKTMLLAFVAIICLSGCLFHDNPTVNYYDINSVQGETFTINAEVEYQQVRNITPVGVNFLYETESGSISVDRVNNWIQSPELMIRRKFLTEISGEQKLNNSDDISKIDVYISIFDFNMNKNSQESSIGLNIKVKIHKDNKTYEAEKQYIESVKIENNTPAGYANALAIATNKVIKNIVEDLNNLKK